MQTKIVTNSFTNSPLNAKVLIEFMPETQAEHDALATLLSAPQVEYEHTNISNVLRAQFTLSPVATPPSQEAPAEQKSGE